MPRVYRCFYVFYFPSVTEGRPYELIEARLAEVPIVASNIAGVRDTVSPVLHSELVPPMLIRHVVEAILVKLKRTTGETLKCFDWASVQFNPEKNMKMALKEFEKVSIVGRHA